MTRTTGPPPGTPADGCAPSSPGRLPRLSSGRSTPRQRASELHGQVAGMIEHLGQQIQGLLEELRTVADPEAAELQIEAVTSHAAEQVATATARVSRAEQAQWRA